MVKVSVISSIGITYRVYWVTTKQGTHRPDSLWPPWDQIEIFKKCRVGTTLIQKS